MLRFRDDENGQPNLVLTKGQQELVEAGLKCGLLSFEMRCTETLQSIRIVTNQHNNVSIAVEAQWLPTGRFRQCWVESISGPVLLGESKVKSYKSLTKAMEALASHARKMKR